MTAIRRGLYLGGIEETIAEVESGQYGVTHILNVAQELTVDRSDTHAYCKCGIEDDGTDQLAGALDTSTRWIHDALHSDGTVLVHCWSGVSRSAVVVVAYLCRYEHLTPDAALRLVQALRPQVDPWPHYFDQITGWLEHSSSSSCAR